MEELKNVTTDPNSVQVILVALLYIGEQVYEGLFASDNISQLTHIVGGIVGAVFGYIRRK